MADLTQSESRIPISITFVRRDQWFRIHRTYHDWSSRMCLVGWNTRQKLVVDNIEHVVWYGDVTQEQKNRDSSTGIDNIIRTARTCISAEQVAELAELVRNAQVVGPNVEEID